MHNKDKNSDSGPCAGQPLSERKGSHLARKFACS